MPNAWLSIPLDDYEGHMGCGGVQQLPVLSELFKNVLHRCQPESVAVLGIAGGNGLDQIDSAITKRVLGIDINQQYLDAVRRRFGQLSGLQLYRYDLASEDVPVLPAKLVHAALIFEHAGLGRALENSLSLVAPNGELSVVLQLPSDKEEGVTPTSYQSIAKLKDRFALVDVNHFCNLLAGKNFKLAWQERRQLRFGKAFWLGVFTRTQ